MNLSKRAAMAVASVALAASCGGAPQTTHGPQASTPRASVLATSPVMPESSTGKTEVSDELPAPPGFNPNGPMLTPDAFKRKIFDLIESMRDRSDLSQTHVERVTGLTLLPVPAAPNRWYATGDISEGWRYSLGITAFNDKDVRINISTIPALKMTNNISTQCTYPFAEFRDWLKGMGFKGYQYSGPHGFLLPAWDFYRGELGVSVGFYYTRANEYRKGDEKTTCIKSLTLSFAIPEEELNHG